MKLFPNFTSIPFDYLLGDELRLQYLDRIDRELHPFERLKLKFVRILLDMLFRVFRFSKGSFYALASSFMTF